ncbi:MAG: transposase [Candidatus Omnitrophica bacterium]|nr:transposase [Candidatus Omnitrophota bacterium]
MGSTIIAQRKRERLNYKGATYHIISRCNNKSILFTKKSHFEDYISIVKKCKEKFGFKLHDYVPMNNHCEQWLNNGDVPYPNLPTVPFLNSGVSQVGAFYYNCSG